MQSRPSAGGWQPGLLGGSHHLVIRVAHWASTVCTNNTTMLNTCLPSGSLEFWYLPGRGCSQDQHPVETLGTKSLMNLLVGNMSFVLP